MGKKDTMIQILEKGFISLEELAQQAGSSVNTARTLIHSDLKKRGYAKEATKEEGIKKYRITGAPSVTATEKCCVAVEAPEATEEACACENAESTSKVRLQPTGGLSGRPGAASIWD